MKNLILAPVLTFFLSSPVWCGDAAGNGGGTNGDLSIPFGASRGMQPWFEGKLKTIRYCYEVSKDFGQSDDALKGSIENAFKVWREYMEWKKIDANLATMTEYVGQCDSSEDLRVYFGVTNEEVKAATPHFDTELAFAFPTKLQRETTYGGGPNWGKGFIWIADQYSLTAKMSFSGDPEQRFPVWGVLDLNAILLHEVGHILGNAHAERTIMDPNIGRWIWHHQEPQLSYFPDSRKKLERKLRSIDWDWEYARCGDLSKRVYSGNIFDPQIPGHEDLVAQETFEMVTGRKLQGNARIRVVRDIHMPDVFLEDDTGSYPLELGASGQGTLRKWYAFGRYDQASTSGLYPIKVDGKQRFQKPGVVPVFLQFTENVNYAVSASIIYSDASFRSLADLTGDAARCERF